MLRRNIGHAMFKCALLVLLSPWSFLGCGSAPNSSPPPASTNAAPSRTMPSKIRLPAVAGLFYPADPAVLSRTLDQLLAEAPSRRLPKLRGLICPHAGYEFSGPTAARAYKALAGHNIQTVVILGPSHYALFAGASVSDADAYQTPLGLVPISAKARSLVGRGPFVLESRCPVERPPWWSRAPKPAPNAGDDTPDTWEHSVEVQLPFLQKTLTNFQLIPVVLGQVDSEQVAQTLASQLDDQTLVVASSDLSHYYPYDIATNLDHHCIQAILDLDIDKMKDQEACGKLPILALMSLAKARGWTPQLLDARNSGDTSGERDRVVGYAAIAFYEPVREAYAAEDRQFLLKLARTTLANIVTNGPAPEISATNLSPKLAETRACFVTLTEQGRLRGCIGHIFSQEPLYRAVEDNAENAALRDPRFVAVQPSEAPAIRIEISVLTKPQPVAFRSPDDLLNKLQPDDGVVLKIGSHSATYLPQVWEQIPDKTEFLNQLSEKAGCEPAAWRGQETSVFIYHVEAFKESD